MIIIIIIIIIMIIMINRCESRSLPMLMDLAEESADSGRIQSVICIVYLRGRRIDARSDFAMVPGNPIGLSLHRNDALHMRRFDTGRTSQLA